jgi:hypothetical protein
LICISAPIVVAISTSNRRIPRMNLLDALKSGLPVRRPEWTHGWANGWVCSKYILDCLSRGDLRPWGQEDLFAEDWEVRTPSVTITEDELRAALHRCLRAAAAEKREAATYYGNILLQEDDVFRSALKLLAKELGL